MDLTTFLEKKRYVLYRYEQALTLSGQHIIPDHLLSVTKLQTVTGMIQGRIIKIMGWSLCLYIA